MNTTRMKHLSRAGGHLALLLCAGLGTGMAVAEPKSQDAGLQQVLRKAQGVVRQLTEEKAALETQKAALETEKTTLVSEKEALLKSKAELEGRVKKLEDTLKPLPAELQRCKAGVLSLQKAKTDLEARLAQARAREEQAFQKQQAIVAKARDIQGDNALLLAAVKEREQWITTCGHRNQELVKVLREAVTKYKEKSFWEAVEEAEPFTGIGRIKTENAAEEFRYKIEHLKTTPFQPEVNAPAGAPPDKKPASTGEGEVESP
jgi:chromosome segregation ATPase